MSISYQKSTAWLKENPYSTRSLGTWERFKAKAGVVCELCAKMLTVEYNREMGKRWKSDYVLKIRELSYRGVMPHIPALP